jgi:hypothetical protein
LTYYIDHLVLDSLEHWEVFKDDKKIERFLTSEGDFTDRKIDWDGLDGIFEVVDLGDKDKIPKGLVPFEQIFDRHDMCR